VVSPLLPLLGVRSLYSIDYGWGIFTKYSFQILYGQSILYKRLMGANDKSPGFGGAFFDF
jgi:hypothetical protein